MYTRSITPTSRPRGGSRDPAGHGTAIFLSGVFDPQNDQIVARALRAIGMDVVIKRLPINQLFATEHTAGAPFDLVTGGYGIDYPDPYDILNTSFDGNSITRSPEPERVELQRPGL